MSVHAKTMHQKRGCRPIGRLASACLALVVGFLWLFGGVSPKTVYADTPAVTDFGLNEAEPAWSANRKSHQCAMFVTLYADGHHRVEFHKINGDAVVLFNGGRSPWHLNHGLMWYVQMPVYVREVRSSQTSNSEEL